MAKSKRLTDLFHLLKVIKRTVDDSARLATAVLQNGAADRELLAELLEATQAPGRVAPEPSTAELSVSIQSMFNAGVRLHAVCQRLLVDSETLAKQLDTIRRDLETAGISPRTRNVGKQGRQVKAHLRSAARKRT